MTLASASNGELDSEKSPGRPISLQTDLESGKTPSAEALPNETHSSTPERTIKGFRWFLVCIAIFSANLLYGLDTTISADLQGVVSKTFDNVTQLGWLGIGFNLGATVAILPLGKAYGIFNTKWLYIGCLTMFAAGSALCGAAPNMNALIIGRVWAGVGGAGMYLG
jgi:predicted MFS family arabinose efflux permease